MNNKSSPKLPAKRQRTHENRCNTSVVSPATPRQRQPWQPQLLEELTDPYNNEVNEEFRKVGCKDHLNYGFFTENGAKLHIINDESSLEEAQTMNAKILQIFHEQKIVMFSMKRTEGDEILSKLFDDPALVFLDVIAADKKHIKTALINQAEFNTFNSQYVAHDALRLALSRKTSAKGNMKYVHQSLEEVLKFCKILRLVHPDTTLSEALGDAGFVYILKKMGLTDQNPHSDFNHLGFISYVSTLISESSRKRYNKKKDGGVSLFINPNKFDDYIRLVNGQYVLIKAESWLIMDGDWVHYGTGQYQYEGGIIKIFVYFDPPGFDRKNNVEEQDVVALLDHNRNSIVVRESAAPFRVLMQSNCVPYLCSGCTSSAVSDTYYFAFPFCKSCLLNRFNLLLSCHDLVVDHKDASKNTPGRNGVQYTPSRHSESSLIIPAGQSLSVQVTGQLMSRDEYRYIFVFFCVIFILRLYPTH